MMCKECVIKLQRQELNHVKSKEKTNPYEYLKQATN